MRISKRVLAGVLTLSLLPAFPTYAATTYANPSDLIEDMVEVALTDVESSTKDDAIAEMKGKITLSGDEVSYDGSVIGYWYSDASEYIYANASKTDTILSPYDSDSWEVAPDFLETVLTDVNEDLVETIVPVGSDWNKIIGKYDVTLGDLTFPADQWVELTPVGSGGTVSNALNLSKECQKYDANYDGNTDTVFFFNWQINSDGSLYISDTFYCFGRSNLKYCTYTQAPTNFQSTYIMDGPSSTTPPSRTADFVYRVALDGSPNAYAVQPQRTMKLYFGMADNSSFWRVYNDVTTLSLISDPSVKNTESWQNNKTGIAWITTNQTNINLVSAMPTAYQSFFATQSSSKTVIGNSILRRNLSKFKSLTASDTIVVSPDGWTINGITSIDNYLGEQVLTMNGESAVMQGIADVEQLNFRVIVPTTLPMHVDRKGNVTTADNAKIRNESNAPVKITDLVIEENPNGGWTLVDTTPSTTRGANEFTFGTSLNIGDTIAINTDLPFTYEASLSPPEDGIESIDLVTVTATFDWAE